MARAVHTHKPFPPQEGDLGIQEIADKALTMMKAGWVCYIKWTCPMCGDRVTSDAEMRLAGTEQVTVFARYRHDKEGCYYLVDSTHHKFGFTAFLGVRT